MVVAEGTGQEHFGLEVHFRDVRSLCFRSNGTTTSAGLYSLALWPKLSMSCVPSFPKTFQSVPGSVCQTGRGASLARILPTETTPFGREELHYGFGAVLPKS